MAKKITMIELTAALPETPEDFFGRREKVAAYARVSTDHEEQQTSLAAQTDYYKKKILANPGWEFAGIYADDGQSGTSFHRREAFNRMIQDCRDGKITMILTKSISRFARNTVDSIKFIRELKSLGIGVMFEKENIWSLDSKGEFLLTVMSSLAQEESRSISENVCWGHRKRMADGKYSVAFSRFLGYDQGKNGEFVINEDEAVYVRRIFSLYIQGYSAFTIAAIAEEEGIPSPTGKENWHGCTVEHIISNEKYKGDALLQKTYTKDYLTKEQKKNEGELPQYYVKGGHPAIIAPELFDYVQNVVKQRNGAELQYSGQNPFSGKMICGVCGNYYGHKPWHCTDLVWVCRERGKTGHTCSNTHIYDYAFWYHLKQIMVTQVRKRPSVMRNCDKLINEKIIDPERRKAALAFIRRLTDLNPDALDFGEEPAHIISEIKIFPENQMTVTFLDGKAVDFSLRRFTPKLGWWTNEEELILESQKDDSGYEITDAEKRAGAAAKAAQTKRHLTQEQKRLIDSLRRKGAGYKKIANTLCLNENTVKTYCRRHSISVVENNPESIKEGWKPIIQCKNCGKDVVQMPGRKAKLFCCDRCRNKWWNSHLDCVERKSFYEYECQACGRKFVSYANRGRKYCSHDCYIRARFGDEENGTKPVEG